MYLPKDWRSGLFRRVSDTRSPDVALADLLRIRGEAVRSGTGTAEGLRSIDAEIARLRAIVAPATPGRTK